MQASDSTSPGHRLERKAVGKLLSYKITTM